MKRILLASTAIVAFAGAAAADITFSGSAKLGYNDTDNANPASDGTAAVAGDDEGFYTDLDMSVAFSTELDNGMTATAGVNFNNLDDGNVAGSDFVVSLAADGSTLTYGDTQYSAKKNWSAVGSMDNDAFRAADGENVLRGDLTLGGFDVSLSSGTPIAQTNPNAVAVAAGDADLMSLSAGGTFGNVSVALAHQNATIADVDGDDNGAAAALETTAVRVGTTLGGADVALGYASNDNGNSTGLSVSYPMGAVTVNASYVSESAGADNWDLGMTYADGPISVTVATDESDDWNLDASYDMGNGLTVYVGADDGGEDTYLGVSYDLGGGASALLSYATDGNDDDGDDEIGAKAYKEGMTVQLSFAF